MQTFNLKYTTRYLQRTGWPPGLLQDDSKELSKWFASRLDAMYLVKYILYANT